MVPWHFNEILAKGDTSFPLPNKAPKPGKICVCKYIMQMWPISLSLVAYTQRESEVLGTAVRFYVSYNAVFDWLIEERRCLKTNEIVRFEAYLHIREAIFAGNLDCVLRNADTVRRLFTS